MTPPSRAPKNKQKPNDHEEEIEKPELPSIGGLPMVRLAIGSILLKPLKFLKHTMECKDRCGTIFFCVELPYRVLGPLVLLLTGLAIAKGEYLVSALLVVIAGLLYSMARFASATYALLDSARTRYLVDKLKFKDEAKGFITDIMKALGMEPLNDGPGGMMFGGSRSVRVEGESDIDRIIRESNELAAKRKKNGDTKGGGGEGVGLFS